MKKKEDLVKGVQEKLGFKITRKDLSEVLSVLPYAIKEIVEEEGEFNYTNFAKISLVDREAKTFRNPGNGEIINKPACKIFKIKKSRAFFANVE